MFIRLSTTNLRNEHQRLLNKLTDAIKVLVRSNPIKEVKESIVVYPKVSEIKYHCVTVSSFMAIKKALRLRTNIGELSETEIHK